MSESNKLERELPYANIVRIAGTCRRVRGTSIIKSENPVTLFDCRLTLEDAVNVQSRGKTTVRVKKSIIDATAYGDVAEKLNTAFAHYQFDQGIAYAVLEGQLRTDADQQAFVVIKGFTLYDRITKNEVARYHLPTPDQSPVQTSGETQP